MDAVRDPAHADVISLRGLSAKGHHGVLEFEREQGQTFVVDVDLELEFVDDDDLASTVDYSELASAVVAIIAGQPVNLLETLAIRIAERCLDPELVSAVRVVVHKPQAPITVPFEDVSVQVHRRKK